ncbi:DNA-processing protein DprA [Patescibacteria group bacterium]|nr:DNA-processing protein DprA [Patescibacteria group bacterium]
MEEKIFANALNQSLQIDAAALSKLKKYFGSFKKAWVAPFGKFAAAAGKKKIVEFRADVDPEKEFKILEKENIKILLEEEFPALLKEIFTPPQILYIKGTLPGEQGDETEEKIYLTVVGPRRFSAYGKGVCEKIITDLATLAGPEKIIIVSGMALGIDTIAHKTALKNNVKTIAVLGNGLSDEAIFPPQNLPLAREITQKGCLVSEYPLNMKATYFTFPQRNRIAAGLSHGTLVVEAPQRSGSLITAFLALENNREVFAVPGGIFSANSEGTNNLLKLGASPVTTAEDILRALGIETENRQTIAEANLSPEEQKIISLLFEPLERDELIRKSGLSPREINPALTQMEIKGIIKELGNRIYKI